MTAQFDGQSVADWVHILERQNRKLRILSGFATLVAIVALIVAAVTALSHKTIRAERFVIQDSNGKVRATLDAADGAALHMYDASGKDRVAIAAPQDGGPFIVLAESKAHMAIIDNSDRPLWFVPGPNQGIAQLPPCPGADPLGLSLKTPCTPLSGKQ
jgi:hypothetical protein